MSASMRKFAEKTRIQSRAKFTTRNIIVTLCEFKHLPVKQNKTKAPTPFGQSVL